MNRTKKQKIQPWELEELKNIPNMLQKLEEEQAELAKKLEQKELYSELTELIPDITRKLKK